MHRAGQSTALAGLALGAARRRIAIDLEREGRRKLAYDCFACLPTRVALDLAGWADEDIFSHA